MTRSGQIAKNAWAYLLAALERPEKLPGTLAALAAGINPGQYLKLNWPWVRQSGIRTVIDVGAHKGEFACAILAVLPSVRIYAFEPLEDCYNILRRKLGANGQAFLAAVGRRNGELTLWRSSYAKSSSILPMAGLHKVSFPWTAETTPQSVEMKSLDACNGHLELDPKVLLKIDVQGYEAEVLRGAPRLLEKVDYVLLEISFRPLYEGQASFAEIHGILQGAGFSYSGNLEQLLSPLDGSLLQADALFLRTSQ
ncbi:MAG TPA: FkbM family methyltransferase [Methylomirabilota bacterium]|nr:FkbM family methyltransferase [Methylomirabilota bacterium]